MKDLKTNSKIVFIPGWLDSGEFHGYKNSLDIWSKNIDLNNRLEIDLVVAHSIGALAALYNWNVNKNYKIILINPVLTSKNIYWRWFISMMKEGTHCPPARLLIYLKVFPAIHKAIKLFKIPVTEIINSIPKDNLIVIYGKKDKYLYDRKLINSFGDKGFRVVCLNETGHNYKANIETDLIELIDSI